MARALIVGCGCRGRLVGTQLLDQGWEVRGTSRRQEGLEPIEEAGIEPALADPADPGSVLELISDVTVVYWLLGSAQGEQEDIAAIHGASLERLLERLVDTPVRGFVYEAAGSVEESYLEQGSAALSAVSRTSSLPVGHVNVPPDDLEHWFAVVLAVTQTITEHVEKST